MLDIAAAAELAGYRIDERVGRGGSADVYRATRAATGQVVALKVLSADADPRLVDREVQLLRGIGHPGVVQLVDSGDVGSQRYVATQWVEGPTLAQVLLDDAPLAPVRAMRIFRQMTDALAAVHAGDVVHGDLTPANIIVGEADLVTLVDFGIGRSGEVATITLDAEMSGTPRYLAPEVIEGATPSPASDQYSSAVVLYEMLTGRWPFPGEGTVATVLHHQLMTPPTPLREVDAWLPATAEAAMDRALRKNPNERFDSIGTFADALSDTARAKVPASSDSVAKPLWWSLAAFVVALIAFAGFMIVRGGDGPEAEVVAADASAIRAEAAETDAARVAAAEADAASSAADDVVTEPIPTAVVDGPGVGADESEPPADESAASDESAVEATDPATAGTTGDTAESTGASDEAPEPTGEAADEPASEPAAEAESAGDAAPAGPDSGDGDAGIVVLPWPAGTAGAADCNILTVADFDDGRLPHPDLRWVSLGAEGEDIELSRILRNGGIDDSNAIEVGEPNSWGAYSELVDVVPGTLYFASGFGRVEGAIESGALFVTWVDAGFTEFAESEWALFTEDTFTKGELWMEAPPAAEWAVFTVFKDGSAGRFIADELVFTEGEQECVKELVRP